MAQPTNVGHVKRKADALKGVSPKGGGKAEPPQKKKVSAGSNLVQAFKNPDEMQDSALKNIMGAFRTTFGKKGDLEARKREGVRSKLAQWANPSTRKASRLPERGSGDSQTSSGGDPAYKQTARRLAEDLRKQGAAPSTWQAAKEAAVAEQRRYREAYQPKGGASKAALASMRKSGVVEDTAE